MEYVKVNLNGKDHLVFKYSKVKNLLPDDILKKVENGELELLMDGSPIIPEAKIEKDCKITFETEANTIDEEKKDEKEEEHEYTYREFRRYGDDVKIERKMRMEGWEPNPVREDCCLHRHLIEFDGYYRVYFRRTLKRAAEEKARREIKHNNFHDGNVQSLGFIRPNNKRATVGVIRPGKFYFDIAKVAENIVVIFNKININGQEYKAISSCYIKVGDPIIFEADEPAAYICYYDDE